MLGTDLSRTSRESERQPFEAVVSNREPSSSSRWFSDVRLTGAFRTAGFLNSIAPEDLKNLLYLLAFTGPTGRCQPTVDQLAQTMQVSREKTSARMRKLMELQWQGSPMVTQVSEAGAEQYLPSAQLLGVSGERSAPPATVSVASPQTIDTLDKATMLPDVTVVVDEEGRQEKLSLRDRLQAVGLDSDQIDHMLMSYPEERIKRQLDWLPRRRANNPASFLLAAIRDDYEKPRRRNVAAPEG